VSSPEVVAVVEPFGAAAGAASDTGGVAPAPGVAANAPSPAGVAARRSRRGLA
jgi:hypothetical protein